MEPRLYSFSVHTSEMGVYARASFGELDDGTLRCTVAVTEIYRRQIDYNEAGRNKARRLESIRRREPLIESRKAWIL